MRTAVFSDISEFGIGSENKYKITDIPANYLKSQEFRNIYEIDQDRDLIDPISVDGSKQPNLPISTNMNAELENELSGENEDNFLIGLYGSSKYINHRKNSSLPLSKDNALRIVSDTIKQESRDPIKIQTTVSDFSANPLLMRAVEKEMDITGDTIIDETGRRSQDFRSSITRSIASFQKENNLFKSVARKQIEANKLQNYANKQVEEYIGGDLSEAGKILLQDILSQRNQAPAPQPVESSQPVPFGSGTPSIVQTQSPNTSYSPPVPPPPEGSQASSATRVEPIGAGVMKSINKLFADPPKKPPKAKEDEYERVTWKTPPDPSLPENQPHGTIVRKRYNTRTQDVVNSFRRQQGSWF